jgi:N-acetylglucosamine malate deacetylase 1
MQIKGKKILFVGAHPDDIEIGCGGTLFKLKEDNEIHIITFSHCEDSVPKGFKAGAIKEDFLNAMEYMKPNSFFIYDVPVRRFPEYRQEILDTLCRIKENLQPDVVFYLSHIDTHQDHEVIANECYRAFKSSCTLITYESTKNNTESEYNYIVKLEEKHVKQKIELLNCYKTQMFRPYFNNEMFMAKLRYKGFITGNEFAEVFKIVKMFDNE